MKGKIKMNNLLLKETENLYIDIDTCVENIIHSRLKKDEKLEQMALLNMETIMVRTMQHLQCILDSEKKQNNDENPTFKHL